jgi:hypothetical protein
VDIADNEVRRAGLPPSNGDSSPWFAVWILIAFGNVAIRGNILESFGGAPTVFLGFALSCVFTDNQCFLDNVKTLGGNLPDLVIWLGFSESSNAGAIIASNNFVHGSGGSPVAGPGPAMVLNPKILIPQNPKGSTVTVLGNITSGYILVGPNQIEEPWASLNVQNV